MKGVEVVFLVVICSFYIKAVSSKLDDILIAVKTSKYLQNFTLPPIITTWFETAKHQTWFFTDYNNPIHQAMTNDHLVVTKCPVDNERSPCCQMSAAIKLFMQTHHKWLCYFEDETYVNVPRLVIELQNYNYQEDWYIGQKYARRRTQYKGYGKAFWYAASGAGWCISRPLAKKVLSFMSNFGFVSTCIRFDQPGDMTLGFIVGGLLGLNLTIVPRFHSNYEYINQIPLERLRDQITLSYGGENHVIKVPGLTLEKDPTRFISLHCFLFPCSKRCDNHPFRRKCQCHHNKKPPSKADEILDSSNELQDLTVNLYYQDRLRPTGQENYGSAKDGRQSDETVTSYRNERPTLTKKEEFGRAKEWQRPDLMEISYKERPKNKEQEDLTKESNKDWRRSDPKIISYHNERLKQISQDNGETVKAWRQPEPSANPYNERNKKIARDNDSTNKEWWWSVSTTDPTLEDDYIEKPEKKKKKGRMQEYYRSANTWQLVEPTLSQNLNEKLGLRTEKNKKRLGFDAKTHHNKGRRPKIQESSRSTKEWAWDDSVVEPNDYKISGPGVEEISGSTSEWGLTYSALNSLVEYDYDDKTEKNQKTKRSRLRTPKTIQFTKKWQTFDSTMKPNHNEGPRPCIEDNSCLTEEWDWADSTIEPKLGWASTTVKNSYLEDDFENKPELNEKKKRSRLRSPKILRKTKKRQRIDSTVKPNHNEGSRPCIEDNSCLTKEWDWADSTIEPKLGWASTTVNSYLEDDYENKPEINDKTKRSRLGSPKILRKTKKWQRIDSTVKPNLNEGSRPCIEDNSCLTKEWEWAVSTIEPKLGWASTTINSYLEDDYENKPQINEKTKRSRLRSPKILRKTKKRQRIDSTVKPNLNEGSRPCIEDNSCLTKEWEWADSTIEPKWGFVLPTTVSSYLEYDYENKPEKNKKTKRSRPKSPQTFRLNLQRIDSKVKPYHNEGPRPCIEDNSCLTKEWYWADSTTEPKWGLAPTTINSYLEYYDYEDKPENHKKTKRSRLRAPITKNGHVIDLTVNLNHNQGPRLGIEWENNDKPKIYINQKRKGSKLRNSDSTVKLSHNEGSKPRFEGTSGRRIEWWWSKSTIKPYPGNRYIEKSENNQFREYNAHKVSKRTTVLAQIYLLPINK